MMGVLGAKRQAQLYYSRRRNRTLRAVPRLFKTSGVDQGSSQTDPFPTELFDSPVTFRIKVDLTSAATTLFSLGSHVQFIKQADDQFTLTLGAFTDDQIDHAVTGSWDIIIALHPGKGSVRLWNQYGLMKSYDNLSFTSSRWGEPGEDLIADVTLLDELSVYVSQLPRHFLSLVATAPEPGSDDFWLNSTALHFMTGFPHPLFEE